MGRYFERVLGARALSAQFLSEAPIIEVSARPEASSDVPAVETSVAMTSAASAMAFSVPICRLIDVVEDVSETESRDGAPAGRKPSLQQMGQRLTEAIKAEWVRRERQVEVRWEQVVGEEWRQAVLSPEGRCVLAIVCGAKGSVTIGREPGEVAPKFPVLHISSFEEMQGSPVIKRDAWRAIQKHVADGRLG
jgi:hypothetical protein